MLNRILIAATAALFLLAGAVTYAHSEECKIANLTQAVVDLQKVGGTLTEITGSARETFLDKVGPPPGIEGDYKIARADLDEQTIIVIIQGDCINLLGPSMPSQVIDNLTGMTKANQ